MAFNGSGSYSPPGASFPAVASTLIESAKYNAVVNDIATALSTCIAKDGQTTVTANLPMATYRHTGVGNAAALTDYASADQVVDNALTYAGASSAGTDTYAVTLAISPGAYATGQCYQFITDVANTGACTVNFNSLGAKSIKLMDGSDPYDGAIPATAPVVVLYDGTNMVLLNPHMSAAQILAYLLTVDGAGSTLDADTLDGVQLANIAQTNIAETFSSTLTINGAVLTVAPSSPSGAGIELGYVGGAAYSANIDFHSGATAVDYDVRIESSGGSGANGGGTFGIAAAAVQINSNEVWHDGNVANSDQELLGIYHGRFDSTGADVRKPSSFSATSKASTGLYTVTHNLGTTNFTPIATAWASAQYAEVTNITSSTFQVSTRDAAGTLTDSGATYSIHVD